MRTMAAEFFLIFFHQKKGPGWQHYWMHREYQTKNPSGGT